MTYIKQAPDQSKSGARSFRRRKLPDRRSGRMPYTTFLKGATEVNREIYALADGKRTIPEPTVNRIVRMMGF